VTAAHAPPTAPDASPADDRPLPASALPEPQRSAVARLAFGGAVHSADRAQSFVLLAGQIVREGETLAPGIVLERIAPRALTLRVGDAAGGTAAVKRPQVLSTTDTPLPDRRSAIVSPTVHWRCTSGDTTKISPMAVAMVSSWKLPR
jgi:hypothetical protein